MNGLAASLLSLGLAFAGMVALAFAMDRHHEQLTGRRQVPLGRSRPLRVVGTVLLAAALVPCLKHWGATVGSVAWMGFVSAGALAAMATISAAASKAAAGAVLAGLLALAWLCERVLT